MNELYKVYRPGLFKDLVGQPGVVNQLREMDKTGNWPHAMLFVGPSGTGKTTLARIIRKKLNCEDVDFQELNCASERGIDTVRAIRGQYSMASLRKGGKKIWLLDESHQLTPEAQSALLKMLEDTMPHVYFMLATTNPGKLLKTIITRCTKFTLTALKPADLKKLVTDVAKKEAKPVSADVADRIAEVAEGSARMALVILDAVIGLPPAQQMEAIQSPDAAVEGFAIARALMNPASNWKTVAPLIRDVTEEPESVRRIILAYATSVMLKQTGNPKLLQHANWLIWAFRDHWYDCGKAGLVQACYDVLQKRK